MAPLRESAEFRRISSLARLMQSDWHQAENPARHTKRRPKMTNTANNFAAAAFSIIISAGLFAYAIIPASPTFLA